MRELLKLFIQDNRNSANLSVLWDTTKAYMRGQFIKIINWIKTNMKAWETEVCRTFRETEGKYIANPTEDTKRAWLGIQSMSRQLALQLAETAG